MTGICESHTLRIPQFQNMLMEPNTSRCGMKPSFLTEKAIGSKGWFIDMNVASKNSHVIETTLHSLPCALRIESSQETYEFPHQYPPKAPEKP